MLLRDFIAENSGLERDAFLEKYAHPFLLQIAAVKDSGVDNAFFTLAADSQLNVTRQQDYLQCPLHFIKKREGTNFQRMVMVGRTKNNDLVLPYNVVSKFHCHFGTVGSDWYIEDGGSSNGTFIRNRKLTPNKREILDPCIELSLGKTLSFLFFNPEKMFQYIQGMASTV